MVASIGAYGSLHSSAWNRLSVIVEDFVSPSHEANNDSRPLREQAANNLPIRQVSSVGGWGGVFDAPARGHP